MAKMETGCLLSEDVEDVEPSCCQWFQRGDLELNSYVLFPSLSVFVMADSVRALFSPILLYPHTFSCMHLCESSMRGEDRCISSDWREGSFERL